jgi:hypothetical protein
LVGKVLGRWLVLLNALQIADDLFGTGFLFINDALEIVELLIDFLGYLIL